METKSRRRSSTSTSSKSGIRRRATKSHVPAACRAHLACDVERPCKRCVQAGREDNCFDVQHKKRGRPRRRDREESMGSIASNSGSMDGTSAMLVPEMIRSSFSLTQPVQGVNQCANSPSTKASQMVTFFLSMDVCCARVSDESLQVLGLYPHEFAHRSLYDFILPEQNDRLARIHRCLLDNASSVCGIKHMPPTERTTADCFSDTSPAMLMTIANGSQTLKETLSFKTSNGSYVPMETRFYLGGGLGSDLFLSDSLKSLYIVCLAIIDQQSQSKVPDTTMEEDPLRVLLSEMEHPLGLSCMDTSDPSTPSNSVTGGGLLHHNSDDGYMVSPVLSMSPPSLRDNIPFLSKDIIQDSPSTLLWHDSWMSATTGSDFDMLNMQG
ncbi:hypothetical protein LRAMOSA09495 [Lichtheimia ramosa]|uniref:Zn(2)-C6 fungal-type domain-containing protein n=1 Tax=Lichtheimia ramosa TaxID=688394 RepID=A0A077WK90_9FUNG|nr:hypothetical protein LRAMOSA09495 [Lichtheimia ramosa]